MAPRDLADHRVLEQFAAGQRAVGGDEKAVLAAGGEHLVLAQIGVDLDLVGHQLLGALGDRFLYQHAPDIVSVPRALEPEQIAENIDIFDFTLSEDEMERIGALREKMVRIVSPEVRRPVWDVG